MKSLVGISDVQRFAVRVGIDCHRAYSHLAAGAHHAHRNLATVGYQDLAKHGSFTQSFLCPCGLSIMTVLLAWETSHRSQEATRYLAFDYTSSEGAPTTPLPRGAVKMLRVIPLLDKQAASPAPDGTGPGVVDWLDWSRTPPPPSPLLSRGGELFSRSQLTLILLLGGTQAERRGKSCPVFP